MCATEIEELNKRFADERKAVARDIRRANRDLPKKAARTGVVFDLDARRDVLTISLGSRPHDFYTQGNDDFYLDVELGTDKIVGFTILDFEREFLNSELLASDDEMKLFFTELQPLLAEYGTISFPPQSEGTSKVGKRLGALFPPLTGSLRLHTA